LFPCHLVVIYRPPYSQRHPITISTFLEEFPTFVTDSLVDYHNIIITGDFNIHYDDLQNNDARSFRDSLTSLGLIQHVSCPTHINGRTLDLIITQENGPIKVTTPVPDYYISDHCFISTAINIPQPHVVRDTITFRKLKTIDKISFARDLEQAASKLLSEATTDVNHLVTIYDTTFKAILDKYAPLITKPISCRKKVPWFDAVAIDLKRHKRKLERKWRNSKTETDKSLYQDACVKYKDHLTQSKDLHFNQLIAKCGKDSKKLFNVVNQLTGKKKQTTLPDTTSNESLSEEFANFFLSKITDIRQELDQHDPYAPNNSCGTSFTQFKEVSQETIHKLLIAAKPASCDLDPLPSNIVKEFADIFSPVFTRIVNMSLAGSTFTEQWKDAIIIPLIKKISLDKNVLSHYRQISNLSFLSKIAEKSALSQLCPYMEK
jgi:hypothetical protein